MLLSIKAFGNLPVTFLLFFLNFIPLWSENTLCIILIILNLLWVFFFFVCGSGYGLGICSVSTEEDECSAVE